MLDLGFINEKNELITVEVSEDCYEKLSDLKIYEKVYYKNKDFEIEGEESESYYVAELNDDNRTILLKLIEKERHRCLNKLFKQLDDNPTIKEIRKNTYFIKELTEIYECLNSKNNKFFSYDV